MLIFDLDGTLIDSRADLTAAVNAMRRSYGLEPHPVARVTGWVGNGLGKLVERALSDASGIDRAEAQTRMQAAYAADPVAETRLYDGVRETLAALAVRGVPLAIATNKPEAVTRRILAALGVAEYFAVVVGGGRLPLKPDPASLRYCLDEIGVPVESGWMIGDHYTDLEAARHAGMRRAWAAWGFGDPREEAYDRRLECFREVETLV